MSAHPHRFARRTSPPPATELQAAMIARVAAEPGRPIEHYVDAAVAAGECSSHLAAVCAVWNAEARGRLSCTIRDLWIVASV